MSFKMKYTITPSYLTKGSKRRSGTALEKMRFVVAHDTGNPQSTAIGNVTYYENSKNEMSASAHIFVDDKNIIECVPLLTANPEKAWHVLYEKTTDNKMFGDDANDCAAGVEYCYGTNINSDEAYKRYVWTIAYICYKFNVDPKNVVGHHVLDPERKTDPKSGLAKSGRTYEQLLKDVVSEYKSCTTTPSTPTVPVKPPVDPKPTTPVKYAPTINKDRVNNTDIMWMRLDPTKIKVEYVYEKGATVQGLIKKHGADFGINMPFFSGNSILANSKIGDTIISSGASIAKTKKWHSFAFKDGKPVIGMLNFADKYDFLVQSSPKLVSNGSPSWSYYGRNDETAPDILNSKCQRTAVGIDKDGNLIVAVSDGREGVGNVGLSIQNISEFMFKLGAIQAMNGDGGSSSILATKDKILIGGSRVTNHAILITLL